MLKALFANGGRKLWLVGGVIAIAIANDIASLGVAQDTITQCLYAAVGGSGTIALEDGLKALFGIRKTKTVMVNASTGEVKDA